MSVWDGYKLDPKNKIDDIIFVVRFHVNIAQVLFDVAEKFEVFSSSWPWHGTCSSAVALASVRFCFAYEKSFGRLGSDGVPVEFGFHLLLPPFGILFASAFHAPLYL